MEGDMNPLAGMPSSLVVFLRTILAWSSIQRPAESFMLHIRGENNQSNMSAQINLIGALKVWRLLKF